MCAPEQCTQAYARREWDVIHISINCAFNRLHTYGSDLFLTAGVIGNVYIAPAGMQELYCIDVAPDVSVAMACSTIVGAGGDGTPLYAVPVVYFFKRRNAGNLADNIIIIFLSSRSTYMDC